jgi:hypothetical protein
LSDQYEDTAPNPTIILKNNNNNNNNNTQTEGTANRPDIINENTKEKSAF